MAYAVPILTGLTTPVTFLENAVNAAPQLIDAHVSFTAAGNPTNFNGGTLTVTGLLPEDTVAIRNQGTSFSQIGISGSNVTFGPVVLGGGVTVIGSFAGGDGSTLTVTFNANAFTAAIEALIENLTYANSSDTPTASRSLELKVTDAAGFAASGIEFAAQTGLANPFNGVDVGNSSTPSLADLDGDGDLDAVVGASNGILHYFENTGSAIAAAFTERTGAANPLNGIDVGLFSAPTFADLDGDGDLDAVIGENGGSLKYFENTGAGFALVVNVTAQNDAAVPDFSSDSKSDILWQSGSGTAAAWLMDGTSSTSVGAIGSFNPGPAWHIKATGDFNGDSKSDIVWQGDTGAAALWLLDGTNVTFAGQIGPFNPGPSWQIKDTGDFNGDGKSDIIWQGNDGTAAMWLMDGPNATFAGPVGSNPGPTWQIKGTGDFNGDGKSDILWQGQDGTPAVWLMDGTHATFVGAVGPFNPGPSWEIKGTGDFNGDGKADIIWQNDNGTPAIWLMDGTNVTSAGAVGPFNPGPSWHIEGTGDFNGDSKADILWQNDDGTPAIWTMDGTNVVSIGAAGSFNPGSDWHVIA